MRRRVVALSLVLAVLSISCRFTVQPTGTTFAPATGTIRIEVPAGA